MNNIYELTLNSDILVQREGNTGQLGSWQGLYKLVIIEGEYKRENRIKIKTYIKNYRV